MDSRDKVIEALDQGDGPTLSQLVDTGRFAIALSHVVDGQVRTRVIMMDYPAEDLDTFVDHVEEEARKARAKKSAPAKG